MRAFALLAAMLLAGCADTQQQETTSSATAVASIVEIPAEVTVENNSSFPMWFHILARDANQKELLNQTGILAGNETRLWNLTLEAYAIHQFMARFDRPQSPPQFLNGTPVQWHDVVMPCQPGFRWTVRAIGDWGLSKYGEEIHAGCR